MEQKTAYQLSTSVNEGILEILVTGVLSGNDISKIQREVDILRNNSGNKVLLDVRAVSEGKTFSDTLYYLRQPESATGKTAILDHPGNEFIKPFFERLSKGSFFTVRWFSDFAAARKWLQSDDHKINFNF